MNFHSVLDVCFCVLQQLRQFMTLLKYLWQQHLRADRLMISMFVAGFISLIWNSPHDVCIRLSVHLCCYIWCRSPGDIDYFWQAGCLVGFFVVVLFDSATATCQWSTALIRKNKPTSSKMLRRTYRSVFATEILQIELNFTVYYFYIVSLEHRVLMQAELPKNGSAVTQSLASGISNFHFLFVLVSAELSI